MKVLYITEIFPDPARGLGYWGGGERQFYEIAKRIASMGHEVTVLTCRFPGQNSRDVVDGIEVNRVGTSRDPRTGVAAKSPVKVAGYLLETAREALQVDCDIIHCNAYYPIIAGRLASFATRRPMVATIHDMPRLASWTEYAGSAFWGRAGYLATVAAAKAANGEVIAVSERARAKLAAFGLSQVRVIPNGVDHEMLGSWNRERKKAQVLYVGRLAKYKRVDTLIRAFAELAPGMPGSRLVIVGDGPERMALQRLATELSDRVRFMGTVPSHAEVASIYKESSLFVLPSVLEGEGIVLKEAMMAGVPVVATRARGSGVLDLVRDGWNGLLVPPDDAHLLAEAMRRALTDEQLQRSLITNGKQFAEKWTWDNVACEVMEVYRSALGKSQARRV